MEESNKGGFFPRYENPSFEIYSSSPGPPAQPNKVLVMVSPCMEGQVALLTELAHGR